MMKKKVFIDGSHGTTGLKIHERLDKRDDIELIAIPAEKRKAPQARQHYLNSADIVFLCLPDDAARESVSLLSNPAVRVIDASTAHRTAEGWAYGMPELNPLQREKLKNSARVSVPGCYATGFCAVLHPMVSEGFLSPDYPVTSYAITGYSGGGNQMISAFQADSPDREAICCRPKNLNLVHKHLPEMQKFGLLKRTPIFTPIVGDFFQGMLVFVPLYTSMMTNNAGPDRIRSLFADYYRGERFIRVSSDEETASISDGFLSPTACNGTNMLELFVFGRNDRLLIVARLDNLGKGASGAAVQNMNILLGVPEDTGSADAAKEVRNDKIGNRPRSIHVRTQLLAIGSLCLCTGGRPPARHGPAHRRRFRRRHGTQSGGVRSGNRGHHGARPAFQQRNERNTR